MAVVCRCECRWWLSHVVPEPSPGAAEGSTMWVIGAPQLCGGERLQQPHLFVPASPGLLSPAAGWVMVPGARVSEEPWPELLDSASPNRHRAPARVPTEFPARRGAGPLSAPATGSLCGLGSLSPCRSSQGQLQGGLGVETK